MCDINLTDPLFVVMESETSLELKSEGGEYWK